MSLFPIKQGLFAYDVVDHHAILGCPLDATPQEIRKSYLNIARRLHPDKVRGASPQDQELAAKLFSKLVNPAYELLSREEPRREHLLILQQTIQNVAAGDRPQFTNPESQQLQGAKQNLELIYRKVFTPLTRSLYEDFPHIFTKVAQLSEYNLIFLLVKSSTGTRPPIYRGTIPPKETVPPTANINPSSSPKATTPPVTESLTPFERSLRRAQEAYDRHQYDKAIAELKSTLKINPKDAQAHCLLGMAYLRSNMVTMAKVHIKTAGELDSTNPQVVAAKRELSKYTTSGGSQGDGKKKSGGMFGGLFGGKKK